MAVPADQGVHQGRIVEAKLDTNANEAVVTEFVCVNGRNHRSEGERRGGGEEGMRYFSAVSAFFGPIHELQLTFQCFVLFFSVL